MNEILEIIKNAIKGKDVRMALHDAMKKISDQEAANYEKYNQMVINAGNSNAEIVDARGSYETLDKRLDNIDNTLNETIIKNDFTFLTGSITGTQQIDSTEMEGQVLINFPTGFDKDNCICISVGLSIENLERYSYGTLASFDNVFAMQSGGIGKEVKFRQSDMYLNIYYNWNIAADVVKTTPFKYKIVLMKIG